MPKNVAGNLYVHRLYLDTLAVSDRSLVLEASAYLPKRYVWDIVKLARGRDSVTFSRYPDFDTNPHPELAEWIKIALPGGQARRGEGSAKNPLILHRKETFVSPAHVDYARFAALTRAEEQAGLYAPQHLAHIGRKQYWEALLAEKGLYLVGHELRALDCERAFEMTGRTAIARRTPSLPARRLAESGLLKGPVFDWGCGRGADLAFYRERGLDADGYDPHHYRTTPPQARPQGEFSSVTCFYVLNVMAFQEQRIQLLKDIFAFLPPGGQAFLAVRTAAEIESQRGEGWKPMLDGWLTTSGTFQKGFEAADLIGLLERAGFRDCTTLLREPLVVRATRPAVG